MKSTEGREINTALVKARNQLCTRRNMPPVGEIIKEAALACPKVLALSLNQARARLTSILRKELRSGRIRRIGRFGAGRGCGLLDFIDIEVAPKQLADFHLDRLYLKWFSRRNSAQLVVRNIRKEIERRGR